MIICVETMIAVCWDHRQHGGKRVSEESTLFTFLAVSHIESLICLHKDIILGKIEERLLNIINKMSPQHNLKESTVDIRK